jgi:hypothetical protein
MDEVPALQTREYTSPKRIEMKGHEPSLMTIIQDPDPRRALPVRSSSAVESSADFVNLCDHIQLLLPTDVVVVAYLVLHFEVGSIESDAHESSM